MSTIKGYMVRMWTSDQKVHSEKFFTSTDRLEARREAFAYADNLLDVMEEAKQAGVINYSNPEEILDPDVRIEDVVIGSVHVTVMYEESKEGIVSTDEDLIYMPVANEGSTVEVPVDEERVLQIIRMETIDLTDPETIRIHNKESEYYLKTGGHRGIVFLSIGDYELFLLMDDFVRLKNKQMIAIQEMGGTPEEVE
jgi:hypothetical protein